MEIKFDILFFNNPIFTFCLKKEDYNNYKSKIDDIYYTINNFCINELKIINGITINNNSIWYSKKYILNYSNQVFEQKYNFIYIRVIKLWRISKIKISYF